MLGRALVIQLSLTHFRSSKEPLIHIPVRNLNKTHWFTKLDFDGVCNLVCRELPTSLWGERTGIASPRKSFVTQQRGQVTLG